MLDYDIQAHILYVIIPNYTISLFIICDNNDLHICTALCKALCCFLGAFVDSIHV